MIASGSEIEVGMSKMPLLAVISRDMAMFLHVLAAARLASKATKIVYERIVDWLSMSIELSCNDRSRTREWMSCKR